MVFGWVVIVEIRFVKLLLRDYVYTFFACLNTQVTYNMIAFQPDHSEEVKSELLPGFRDEGSVYYDGKGYYFVFNAIRRGKKYV